MCLPGLLNSFAGDKNQGNDYRDLGANYQEREQAQEDAGKARSDSLFSDLSPYDAGYEPRAYDAGQIFQSPGGDKFKDGEAWDQKKNKWPDNGQKYEYGLAPSVLPAGHTRGQSDSGASGVGETSRDFNKSLVGDLLSWFTPNRKVLPLATPDDEDTNPRALLPAPVIGPVGDSGGGNFSEVDLSDNNSPAPDNSNGVKFGLGNIDLTNRPIVGNADGSFSTIRSMDYEEDGEHILIPTVSNEGKLMQPDEAIEYWRKKKQNLGKFKSAAEADEYAHKLSIKQYLLYGKDAK